MSDSIPMPEPVIRTEVEYTTHGTHTTTYEDDVRVSVRTDFTEMQHTGTRSYTKYYDSTGSVFSTHEIYRSGTTRTITETPVNDAGVHTRTFVQTDPENVERWVEIREVKRFEQTESGSPHGHTFLGFEKWQTNDDGSSFGEERDKDHALASHFETDIQGRTVARDYENGAIVRETILDPDGMLGYVSRIKTVENGVVQMDATVFADASTMTLDHTGEVTVRTRVEYTPQGKETHIHEDDVLKTHRIDFDEQADPGTAVYIAHYDGASGEIRAFEVLDRDGTTRNVTSSLPDADRVRTRTIVQTDPENAWDWAELRTVVRYIDMPSEGGVAERIVGASMLQVSDDGSSFEQVYGLDQQLLSETRRHANNVTHISEYESDALVRETVLNPQGLHGFVSRVTTSKDGDVVSERTVYGDGAVTATYYDGGTITEALFDGGKLLSRSGFDGGDLHGWASYFVTYGSDGRAVTARTVNDDGSTVVTDFAGGVRSRTLIDRDGPAGDVSSVLTYDAEGELVQEVTSATGLVTTSDYAGGKLAGRSFVDGGDAFIWSRHAVGYDTSGNRLAAFTINDDGSSALTEFVGGIRSHQVFDRDESKGGMDSERFFSADGTLERVEWTNAQSVEVSMSYAGGRIAVRTALDVADAFEFHSHIHSYRDGKASTATTEFDSGLVRTVTFEMGVMTGRTFLDGGGEFIWQTRQMAYDHKGVVTGSHKVWDDLSVADTGSYL